jgi:hypothetical protein
MSPHRTANRALVAIAAIFGACSSTPAATPPPPPPGGQVPASLAIAAGDGQTAAPATPLPIHPAVLVKDASGLPVAGVTVTFTVDSGGGSLVSTSAVTNADGVATAGAWTLGPAEGHNRITVTAGTLTPVRIGATAVTQGGTLPSTTVGTGGGSISVLDPGPLQGFKLDIPGGALTAPLQVTISSASSAALPHPASMSFASPIITISSNATAPAHGLFRVHIAAAIPAGKFPVVAMVDPVTGFVDALPTVSFDATGVTATGTILDAAQLAEALQASRRGLGTTGSAIRSTASMAYAMMLADSAQLHTVSVDSHFLPGIDDWEFPAQDTPVFAGTGPGEVVAERYYFLNQKSLSAGGLWAKFEKTPGIEVSDAGGIQWSAALAKQFDGMLQPYINDAVALRTANQPRYDQYAIQQIAASMVASGKPQIVVFYSPQSGTYTSVLAYRWDGPSGTISTANPDYPGDQSRHATWDLNGLGCTNFCVAIVGVNHLIGYQTQLDGEFPGVADGSIDKSLFPPRFVDSYGGFAGSGVAPAIDTMFVVDDTTRLWIECPGCSGSYATSLPLKHGGNGIESQQVWVEGAPGHWSTAGGQGTEGFPFDVTQFPAPSGNHFASFQIGIEALGPLNSSAPGGSALAWLGWKQYRVVKFAPKLTVTQAVLGLSTKLTLLPDGGPALPNDLTYVFKWQDSSADLHVTPLPATVSHAFQKGGALTVTMEMHHVDGNGDQIVGETTLPVTVEKGPVWQLDLATLVTSNVPAMHTAADSSERDIAKTLLDNVVLTPGKNLVLVHATTACSSAAFEHFEPGDVVTDTGLVAGEPTIVVAANCAVGAAPVPGTFAIAPLGNGALSGNGPSGANPDDAPSKIGGGTGSISSIMAGKNLSGTITWILPYSGGSATYVLQVHAVLVEPATLTAGP